MRKQGLEKLILTGHTEDKSSSDKWCVIDLITLSKLMGANASERHKVRKACLGKLNCKRLHRRQEKQ